MSLGIVIKAPEGIVLAAESRVTLSTPTGNGNEMLHVNFDNATKLLTFSEPYNNIGVVTYGQAAIGIRTVQTFIPEFDSTLQKNKKNGLSVFEFAKELSSFFMQQWQGAMPTDYKGPDMTINVAGFDKDEPYGRVYSFNIPRTPNPIEQNPPINDQYNFGIIWGGQREIVDRLLAGYDSRIFGLLIQGNIIKPEDVPKIVPLLQKLQLALPIQFMPLQDCVNLATLFIKTTIEAQSLSVGLRGCGGAIDVAIITRNNPLTFINKKSIIVQ